MRAQVSARQAPFHVRSQARRPKLQPSGVMCPQRELFRACMALRTYIGCISLYRATYRLIRDVVVPTRLTPRMHSAAFRAEARRGEVRALRFSYCGSAWRKKSARGRMGARRRQEEEEEGRGEERKSGRSKDTGTPRKIPHWTPALIRGPSGPLRHPGIYLFCEV